MNPLSHTLSNRALVGPAVSLGNRFTPPADGYEHLIPKGEFPHGESGIVQVIDDKALQSMLSDLQNRIGNVLIDNEHFSYDPAKDSEAQAWAAEAYELRGDGLWGKPRWTDVGEAVIKNGRKRFISPVFLPKDMEHLGGNRYRPLRLDTWGLTNAPNMGGMVPLSNRRDASASPADNRKTETKGQAMKLIAQRLGLSADASEETMLAELTKLQNRATTAEQALDPLKNRITTLEKSNTELLTAQVETDLAPLKNRLTDDEMKPLREQLIANRAGTLPIVTTMIARLSEDKGTKPLTNRAQAKTPDNKESAKASEQTRQQDTAVREYRNRNKCSFEAAWAAVRAEKPELFTSAS